MSRWIKRISLALIVAFGMLTFGGISAAHAQAAANPQVAQLVVAATVETAATDLNIPRATLVSELAGRTLTDVIKAHNGDMNQIRTDASTAITTQLAQAVTDGKITQAQSDIVTKNMSIALDRAMSYQFPGRDQFIARVLQGVTIRYLVQQTALAANISARDAVKEIHAGKTLNQIATEHNADPSAIITTVLGKATDQINKLVSTNKLTQDEANTLIANLQNDLTNIMNQPNPLIRQLLAPSATPTPAATPTAAS